MNQTQKKIRTLLESTGYKLIAGSKKIYLTQIERNFNKWMQIQGDKTLRLDYDLTENSIIFDIGGYEGQWASDIYAKLNFTIHIFEPVKEFFQKIETRFSHNKKIISCNFGLADKTITEKIYLDANSSSLYKTKENTEIIKIVDICEYIIQNNIEFIDLMKINIEGGEFPLLNHLITSSMINKIKNLQIQFHDFIPNANEKVKIIQEKLKHTHKLTYQYPFLWENWQLK